MSKENVETIKITSEYITLGQFLKFTNVISNGGEAKFFIANNKIFLNGQQIFERGRPLFGYRFSSGDEGLFCDTIFPKKPLCPLPEKGARWQAL